MRVEDKPSVKVADAAPARAAGDKTAVRPQVDKVSLDGAKQVEGIVQAAQTNVAASRNTRLQELEVAIRQGGYRPNAGQLAEKIVQAAEVDARLRMLFGG
jgi:anti-sigma28 factor (negative regulator of flagellin synthesis)